jgi:hypothetical protein
MMKRRNFLKTIGVALAIPLVGKAAEKKSECIGTRDRDKLYWNTEPEDTLEKHVTAFDPDTPLISGCEDLGNGWRRVWFTGNSAENHTFKADGANHWIWSPGEETVTRCQNSLEHMGFDDAAWNKERG